MKIREWGHVRPIPAQSAFSGFARQVAAMREIRATQSFMVLEKSIYFRLITREFTCADLRGGRFDQCIENI